MGFYIDNLRLRVAIADAEFVEGASIDRYDERDLPPDGNYEPARVHDEVARVFHEELGIHDGYRVETQLLTIEQGASRQGP